MFGIRDWLFSAVENRNEHVVKLFYSALYFAITYILLAYTAHAWSSSNAWDVGYYPKFSIAGMENLINTTGWTVEKVAWVYLAPPIWGLLVSILGLFSFHLIDSRLTRLRTFLFWLSANGFLLYFSYLITGILSGQVYSSMFFTGFVGFYGWLDWSKGTIYGILVIQILVSLLYAFFYCKPILQLNYSRLLASRKQGKAIIFINIVFIPYVIGAIIIAAATFPMDMNYHTVRILSYVALFVFSFLGMGFYKAKHINIVKGGLGAGSIPMFIIITSALILTSRFLLSLKVNPLW